MKRAFRPLSTAKQMKVSDIITQAERIWAAKHGIGIVDIVENRVVGMKSRGVYETPGGTILMEAHEQLEELILDRDTMETKKKTWAASLPRSYTKENGSLLCEKLFRHS